jgi:CRISPR-associated protein Csb1
MADENKEETKLQLTPESVLAGESPLVITAIFEPVAGLDRFQPAGFPEIGHVIYTAPRKDGAVERVCIVDSAASMANHLESVCMRGRHDVELVDDLAGMPYLRCVTGETAEEGRLGEPAEVVVTSLTEGHRIASTYFLGARNKQSGRWDGKGAQRVGADRAISEVSFGDELAGEFGVALPNSKKAHPPVSAWWNVFRTIYKYDPNALVHGLLFPQWQIKIPRVLTSHMEAYGAGRVDRSGVKFDRLGKTTSGQPIFAVDDATAREVRATFILDIALLRSFGRLAGESALGLNEPQKQFLVALALWKIQNLTAAPFRFRSGCHLKCTSLKSGGKEAEITVNMQRAIESAEFRLQGVTDIYWPREQLYSEADGESNESAQPDEEAGDEDTGTE